MHGGQKVHIYSVVGKHSRRRFGSLQALDLASVMRSRRRLLPSHCLDLCETNLLSTTDGDRNAVPSPGDCCSPAAEDSRLRSPSIPFIHQHDVILLILLTRGIQVALALALVLALALARKRRWRRRSKGRRRGVQERSALHGGWNEGWQVDAN